MRRLLQVVASSQSIGRGARWVGPRNAPRVTIPRMDVPTLPTLATATGAPRTDRASDAAAPCGTYPAGMDPIRFEAAIRYWHPDKASGLAVADVPQDLVTAFGGLKQQHVEGTIDGRAFGSNVMPAGGGRLAITVSKAMQAAARKSIGDVAEFEVTSLGRS